MRKPAIGFFRTGPTKPGLCYFRRWPTKDVQLTCACVIANVKNRFSHDDADLSTSSIIFNNVSSMQISRFKRIKLLILAGL